MEYIELFLSELVHLTNEMSPYLLLGFLFAGLLHVYFPSHKIDSLLGRANKKSVINAALLGVPLPLCSCGVIPTGVSFYRNGAGKGATVSFLISTPQTGVDSVMATWSLLGWPLAIIRPVVAFATGVIGGLWANKLDTDPVPTAPQAKQFDTMTQGQEASWLRMLRYAFVDFMEDIAKWLFVGLLLAAVIAVLVPDDFFASYISNPVLEMLVILVASIPVYVCATGSVPIAAVLMMKGLSPGAALVFLMAGPATNAATITVLGKTLGRKTLIAYLLSIMLGAVFFGTLINQFLPDSLFLQFLSGDHLGHGNHMLPHWLSVASSIILGVLMLNVFVKQLRTKYFKKQKTEVVMAQNAIIVKGMNCKHCKMSVETNLVKLDGINSAEANLETGEVKLEGDWQVLDLEKVKETVAGLGFEFIQR